MAKARERGRMRLLGVTGRKRPDLLIGTALQTTTLLVLSCPVWAQPAPNARPAGGSVVAGSAAITQSTNTTTVNQSTTRAAINWQSFNVGSQQQVNFTQPSTSAITLNRVTGPDPSQIAGKISANGQVVLVNQAGVTFYKGAQVNAQSLIVTSADIANANFMAGKLKFDRPGSPNASVVNQGTITVKQAGLAALVAPSVANSGVINAQLGHVVLAGAKTATLDLYGDGLLSLDVSNQVTRAPSGPDGKAVTALVTNTGVIKADGGTVQLTAAAADGVLQNLVQAGGKITANSVGARTGTVTVAGIGGSVTVTGVLRAAGTATGTKGGQVAVNATGDVTLAATARIDASGVAGGGIVAVGTTLQRAAGGPGTTSAMTAENVTIRKGATITANATKAGNGGRVVVLSAGTTTMNGSIAAMGGSQSGNGGFAEVSGNNLGLSGGVNLLAPNGSVGTLLLDPTNLNIIASAGNLDGGFVTNSGTSTLPSGLADGTPPPSTVSAATLATLGTTADVIVQASNNIDVQVPVTVANGLTIQAGSNLTIETGASIQAGGNILLQAGTTNPAGALLINADVTTKNAGGIVQLIAGTGGISLNGNITAPATVDLNTTGGGVTQATSVGLTTSTLQSSTGVTGNVSLPGKNAVSFLGTFQVATGNFQLVDNVALEVDGPLLTPGGNVFLQDTNVGGISVLGTITTAAGGLASFQTDSFFLGSSDSTTGTITTGTFELAPFSGAQTVTLETSGSGLSLPDVTNINAGTVRIGAVTPPGASAPVTEAAAITISGTGGAFDLGNRNLELDASGAINGSNGSLINVTTLSGTGGAWSLFSNNTIADLGNITASSFGLFDNGGLNVNGTVNGGTSATINVSGALAINGGISASAIDLTGSSINISGLVTDGGAGTVNLTANSGAINETGTLIAGVLTGTAFGVADLLGSGASINQVATIGSPGTLGFGSGSGFTASSFALRDGAGLTVAGTVSATSLTGQVFLASTSAAGIAIATTGNVAADTSSGTASLQTDLLVDNATTGVTANTIELAPATAGGMVTLGATGSGLSLPSLTGLVANNFVIGAVTQPNGTAPTTTAGSIAIAGAFNFSSSGTLTLDAASSTAAGASGAVTQTAALTGVQTLSGTADSFMLTSTGNDIATAANLTASGNVALVDGSNLTLQGAISGGNVFVEIARAGGILTFGNPGDPESRVPTPVPATVTAASGGRISLVADNYVIDAAKSVISAPSGAVELAPFSSINTSVLGSAAANQLLIRQNLLSIITTGTLVIGGFTNVPGGATTSAPSSPSVTIDGTLTLSPIATSLELEATGSVTQSAPIVNVGTLLGISGSTTLTNSGNSVGALGNYTASNGFILTDATGLAISGELQAGPAATLNINGALTESGGVSTTLLTGSAVGTASLNGNNSIADLDGFVVSGNAGNFALRTSGALSINGTLNATRIAVTAPQITLGDGSTIVTGGTVRPAGLVAPTSLFPQNGAAGAVFQTGNFTQIGSSTITAQGGGSSTLQIIASGNVQFDPPLGLIAPSTWLILDVPNGRINGDIYVGALDVLFRQPGSANLFGSIAGNNGPTAAALGFIQPEPNLRYLFNGCVIGTSICAGALLNAPALQVENTVFVPVDALLALVTPALVLEPEDKDDLLQLPVVSREDY